jgi:hypothetical protein
MQNSSIRFPFFSQVEKTRVILAFVLPVPWLIHFVRQAFMCGCASARVVTDIAIAVTMCSLLYAQQSKTAHRFSIYRWTMPLVRWRLSTIVVRGSYSRRWSFGRWQLDCSLGPQSPFMSYHDWSLNDQCPSVGVLYNGLYLIIHVLNSGSMPFSISRWQAISYTSRRSLYTIIVSFDDTLRLLSTGDYAHWSNLSLSVYANAILAR